MFYLLNSFSPNMLSQSMSIVNFVKITQEEAKRLYESAKAKEQIINAIGHEGTAKLVSEILEDEIQVNRQAIKLAEGDTGLIFTLNFRSEEGKIYDFLEICKLFEEGKIAIFYFKV